MNKKELKKELAELIRMAKSEWADSRSDIDSFGHGYDNGYLVALIDVNRLIARYQYVRSVNDQTTHMPTNKKT